MACSWAVTTCSCVVGNVVNNIMAQQMLTNPFFLNWWFLARFQPHHWIINISYANYMC